MAQSMALDRHRINVSSYDFCCHSGGTWSIWEYSRFLPWLFCINCDLKGAKTLSLAPMRNYEDILSGVLVNI